MGCGEAKDWFWMTQRHQNLSVNVELSDGRVTGGDEKMAVPGAKSTIDAPGLVMSHWLAVNLSGSSLTSRA